MISAGAVMAGKPEIAPTSGEMNIDNRNRTATTSDVSPVRPPAATPVVDSMKAVVGLVPNIEPTVVAVASASSAALARGSSPFFIAPVCSVTPISVPVVSNNVTSKNANTVVYNPWLKTPDKSRSKNTGAGGTETKPSNFSWPVK
ncbi:hypothetical protein D3C81_1000310 [compost metagenome]